MDTVNIKPLRLINRVMHYPWGSKGNKTLIPQLLGSSQCFPEDDQIAQSDESLPWAELWIGTHPKAPSEVNIEGERIKLTDLISLYKKEILGDIREFPFLLKIISADEILSLQVHPEKKKAEELHLKDPLNYPDNNHKPEIAIALDELQVLAGFKQEEDIWELGHHVRPFTTLLEDADKKSPGKSLAMKVFSHLLNLEIENQQKRITKLIEAVRNNILEKTSEKRLQEEELFLQLHSSGYSNDPGILMIFLLNNKTLRQGEGIFIPPGLIHAYVKGNAVECMTSSDNVLRAGLTRKFKDLKHIKEVVLPEKEPVFYSPFKNETFEYPLPVSDFKIIRCVAEDTPRPEYHISNKVAVVLVLKGILSINYGLKGEETLLAKKGDVILIPAALKHVSLKAISHPLEIFVVTTH